MKASILVRFLSLILLLFFSTFASAQHHGDEGSGGKPRLSLLGGPGFNPDTGLLLGGDGVLTFSTNRADTLLKRSVLPTAFAFFFKGGGLINMRPQVFFNEDRVRLFGVLSFISLLDNYYGVGFETNDVRERGEFTTEHRLINTRINPVLLFRWKETDFFFGGGLAIFNNTIKNPSEGVLLDNTFSAQGGDENGADFFNSGISFRLNYDTRDMPANAYSGLLLEFNSTIYDNIFGSDNRYRIYSLEYRQYLQLKGLGKEKVLAWTTNIRFSDGNVPWTDLSTIGSPFDLRGYYQGQYRDNTAAYFMTEYRHGFELGRPNKFVGFLSKTGFVLWSGMGVVSDGFDSEAEIGALPNLGGGLRFQLQPRINFRVDFGHDVRNQQTLIYLNVTEAF